MLLEFKCLFLFPFSDSEPQHAKLRLKGLPGGRSFTSTLFLLYSCDLCTFPVPPVLQPVLAIRFPPLGPLVPPTTSSTSSPRSTHAGQEAVPARVCGGRSSLPILPVGSANRGVPAAAVPVPPVSSVPWKPPVPPARFITWPAEPRGVPALAAAPEEPPQTHQTLGLVHAAAGAVPGGRRARGEDELRHDHVYHLQQQISDRTAEICLKRQDWAFGWMTLQL